MSFWAILAVFLGRDVVDFFVSSSFWSVMAIWFIAVIMPGADMFLVIRTAVSQGKKCGYFASLGIIIGTIVWLFVGFFFIQALSQTMFFDIVQILGGSYLIFMSYQIFLSLGKRVQNDVSNQQLPQNYPWKSLFYGVLTNLSNPKPPFFIASVLSKVPQSLPIESSLMLLIIMTLIPSIWFCFVVRIFSIEKFFHTFMCYSKEIDFVVIGVFMIFGMSLIFEGVGKFL